MDAETLERLLLDAALGALGPDTAALLAAYLSHDPAAAAEARRCTELVRAARRALAATMPADASVPPFPETRLRAARARANRWIRLRRVSLAAAVMLAAFGLGSLTRWSGEGTSAPGGPPRPASAEPVAAAAAPPRGGIWSLPSRASADESVRSGPRAYLIWDSIARMPRLAGGRL